MVNISATAPSQRDGLFNEFGGAFVENHVAMQLTVLQDTGLYYWKNETGIAEVDFVCEKEGTVYPLEVKAGINARSKSLKSFDDRFQPKFLCRATLKNLKADGKIINFPLYAISEHQRLLRCY